MDDLAYLLRNEHRLAIMKALYSRKHRYVEIAEITGLKPGSIYHHLKILGSLVNKVDQGVYSISDTGRKIMEGLGQVENTRPSVINDNLQHLFWISPVNSVLAVFVVVITILLTTEGIALAGSAIYAVNSEIIVVFDILALLLGWAALFLVEYIRSLEVYNKIWFTLLIRLLSMLPGAVVGLAVYILFQVQIYPTASSFPFIFGITTTSGLIVAFAGEIYLRSQDKSRAIQIAAIPIFIDLLLGLVVLIIG